MNDYLCLALRDGALVETAALRVSPLCGGFMYGEGIFETIAVRGSQPAFLEDHQARLAISAAVLGAAAVSLSETLRARCAEVIAANGLKAGSLKIVLFHDGLAWTELILARGGGYAAAQYERGFRLQTVAGDLRVDPFHALKSLNYLVNIRAKRAARAAGFDEPLLVDPHDRLLEGATTNVFAVLGQEVRTPPLTRGILPGVIRARVLRLSGTVRLIEADISRGELREANEVFVTNALLGIMPVGQIDETCYDLARNPVTRELQRALEADHGVHTGN